MSTYINLTTHQVVPILQHLEAEGIEIPPEARHAAALLLTSHEHPAIQTLTQSPTLADPLSATAEDLAALARERAVYVATRDQLGNQLAGVQDELAYAVGHVLRDHADELLDQLRPRFDQAAGAVFAATRLGIVAGTRADTVIDMGTAAIKAWRALPGHAETLDHIAAIRILLADYLQLPPERDPFSIVDRQYATAFDSTAFWKSLQHRAGLNWWLQLSQGRDRPLRLLSIAETKKLDEATRMDFESAGAMA